MKQLEIPDFLVKRYPPSESECLSVFRKMVDKSMLREISEADYGNDAEEHYETLIKIWKDGIISVPLGWEEEVLTLTQWSEPEDSKRKSEALIRRGHIMRGFCCAALLLAFSKKEMEGYSGGDNQTLVQLLDSAVALDEKLFFSVGCFLTWRIPQLGFECERPFFALALVMVMALDTSSKKLKANQIEQACRWVIEEETIERELLSQYMPPESKDWFFGLTYMDLKFVKWKKLAKHIFDTSKDEVIAALAEKVYEA